MRKRLRQAVVCACRSAAFSRTVDLIDRSSGDRPNLLRVLTYHRVDELEAHPELDPGIVSATPAAFAVQMRYLATRFQPVSVNQVLHSLQGKQQLPPRAVLVTFDDAYRCFAGTAWPIMKRFGISPVLFVPTAFPGERERGFWWDLVHRAVHLASGVDSLQTSFGVWPIRSCAQRKRADRNIRRLVRMLPHELSVRLIAEMVDAAKLEPYDNHVLHWSELQELASGGVALAPHTRCHPFLNRVTPSRLRAEVLGSISDLRERVGQAHPVFSYPGGVLNRQVAATIKSMGMRLAFTTRRGINDLRYANPYHLRRINVGRNTSPPLIHAQMLSTARIVNVLL